MHIIQIKVVPLIFPLNKLRLLWSILPLAQNSFDKYQKVVQDRFQKGAKANKKDQMNTLISRFNTFMYFSVSIQYYYCCVYLPHEIELPQFYYMGHRAPLLLSLLCKFFMRTEVEGSVITHSLPFKSTSSDTHSYQCFLAELKIFVHLQSFLFSILTIIVENGLYLHKNYFLLQSHTKIISKCQLILFDSQ